jgi:hypothetical protein
MEQLIRRQWSWSSTLTIWTGMMAWLSAGHGNLSFSSSERVDCPLSSSDLQPFQGPLPLSSFLRLIWRFLSPPLPTPLYGLAPCQIFFPSGPGNLFFLCFPFTTIFFFFFQFLLSFCFSSSLCFVVIFHFLFFQLFLPCPTSTTWTLPVLSLFTLA